LEFVYQQEEARANLAAVRTGRARKVKVESEPRRQFGKEELEKVKLSPNQGAVRTGRARKIKAESEPRCYSDSKSRKNQK